MRLGKVINSLPRRFEELKSLHRNKQDKAAQGDLKTANPAYDISVEANGVANAHGIVEPWLQKASNDHKPREPLASLSQLSSHDLSDTEQDQSFQTLQPIPEPQGHKAAAAGLSLPVIDERTSELIGEDVTMADPIKVSDASRALQLRLPPSHMQISKQADIESDTPLSQAAHPLESELSSNTVVVNHQAQPSLTFTASIEDYAHKANPTNWTPPRFKKGQSVRIRPGTYAVPYKKLSESRHTYTQLGSYTKGTIHILNKETSSLDPREFVLDEREIMYRIWIPGKVNRTVEFIFACEEDMVVFTECTNCSGYASEFCGGCNKVRYCSDYCLAMDWKNHKAVCNHKGKSHPMLGANSSANSDVSFSTNSEGVKNKAGPRREHFRPDGTVKIVNAHEPSPETLKGRNIIMPRCLRPLTLEEQQEPEPAYFILRVARKQNHKLRERMYRNKIVYPAIDSLPAPHHPETIPENDDVGDGLVGSNLEIPYSAGKSPLGRSSRMGYAHEEMDNSLDLDRCQPRASDFGEEEDQQPSSGKSAESVVEGGPQKSPSNERSLFSRTFFARLPPIRTSHDASKPIVDAKEVDVAVADGKQSSGGSSVGKGGSPQSEPSASSERARVSFQNKIPKALKKLGNRRPSSNGESSTANTQGGVQSKKVAVKPVIAA